MKLFWCVQTRSSRAAWMLEEAGVEYERVVIDIRDAQSRANPAFCAASPMSKVPAVSDGDVHIADSAAICLYIADRYALGELAPPLDDPRRGRYLYWMTFVPGVVEPAMAEKVGGWEPSPARNGWGDFPRMIDTMERGVRSGPWLLGESFTAADVMVGSSCLFMRQFGMLPESEALHAYADRCAARPAYQRAMAFETA